MLLCESTRLVSNRPIQDQNNDSKNRKCAIRHGRSSSNNTNGNTKRLKISCKTHTQTENAVYKRCSNCMQKIMKSQHPLILKTYRNRWNANRRVKFDHTPTGNIVWKMRNWQKRSIHSQKNTTQATPSQPLSKTSRFRKKNGRQKPLGYTLKFSLQTLLGGPGLPRRSFGRFCRVATSALCRRFACKT